MKVAGDGRAQRLVAGVLLVWLAIAPARAELQKDSAGASAATQPSAPSSRADDEFGALFSDPVEKRAEPALPSPRSAWSFSGAIRSETAAWTGGSQRSRLAKQRLALDLELGYRADLTIDRARGSLQLIGRGHGEYDFAYLQRDASFDPPLREAYQWQLIAREAYLNLELGGFELTVGRRIMGWGQGELLSHLNVLNPRDLREPGASALDDLWLGVLMTRAAYALGNHRVELVAVHEPYFGLLAPPLAPFSPLRGLLLQSQALADALAGKQLQYRHLPPHGLRDLGATQFHGRWSFSGRGLDLALQAGSLLEALGVSSLPAPAAYERTAIDLPVYHPRYVSIGHSGALTLGAMLLRWEFSADLARPLSTRRLHTPFLELGAARRTQLNALLGLTYFGPGASSAALEVSKSVVLDSPNRTPDGLSTLWPVETPQIAARVDYRFLKERLRLSLLVLAIGIPDFVALVARGELGYVLVDTLSLSVGYVYYRSGERFSSFYGFGDNSRALATLRWDFNAVRR